MAEEQQKQAAAAAATTTEGNLLDQILQETKIAPTDEGYRVAKQGVSQFIAALVTPAHAGEKVH